MPSEEKGKGSGSESGDESNWKRKKADSPEEERSTKRDDKEKRGGSKERGRRRSRSRERDSRKDDKKDDRSRKDSSRERRRESDRDKDREKRREKDRKERDNEKSEKERAAAPAPAPEAAPKKPLESKTGGVYIPPWKLKQMQKDVTDKSSEAFQRVAWQALKKSLNGGINKVNVSNIKGVVTDLFNENLIRGRGLFTRALLKAQAVSPKFTFIYAALISIINTKMPEIGELMLARLIDQFRRAYKRNDKKTSIATSTFIAHLVNQQVAPEVLALEILYLLIENPNDDSVEIAVGFTKEVGMLLSEVSSKTFDQVFERFRAILHEGEIDERVQFTIENLFLVRKSGFKEFPSVVPELDLVEADDQITHFAMTLTKDDLDLQTDTDVFKFDPDYLANEAQYDQIKKEILGGEDDGAESSEGESESGSESGEEVAGGAAGGAAAGGTGLGAQIIQDNTETNLVNLQRTLYLTIMSSLDFEECAHKLLKLNLPPGQEIELAKMLVECCAQRKMYQRYYGLLGERFCRLNMEYQKSFEETFYKQYETIHRLETNKLRNVAKFFAHLLHSDGLGWQVLARIRLTEADTTSSSRIFIKILFQELSEHLGLVKLNNRLKDKFMEGAFQGIFPKDNPKNTRFAINFFTSIGLGGLTEDLREYLKNAPKQIMQQAPAESSSSSTSSSGSGSSSSDDSSSSSSSSDKKKKEKKTKDKAKDQAKDKAKDKAKESKKEEDPEVLRERQRKAAAELEEIQRRRAGMPARDDGRGGRDGRDNRERGGGDRRDARGRDEGRRDEGKDRRGGGRDDERRRERSRERSPERRRRSRSARSDDRPSKRPRRD